MDTFVGLDVSLKETSVCVLNQDGTCVFEGKVASEPKAIARLIRTSYFQILQAVGKPRVTP